MMRAPIVALAVATALAAQQPAAVEVVGPAAVPSHALLQQLQKGEDELVLFDVGYGVREAVVQLHEQWGHVEGERAHGLRELATALRERWSDTTDADARRVAAVATVLEAMLLGAAFRDPLPEPLAAELREVESGRSGTMRFLAVAAPVDWAEAVPRGGYMPRHETAPTDLAELFRGTVYLRRYLAAWPAATATRWREGAAACRRAGAAPRLDLADEALPILFGSGCTDGLPQAVAASDLAWLAAQPRAGDVHEVLPRMFAAAAASEGRSWADAVLRLGRELAQARPDDALFAAMAPEQWRAKWRDAATFAYVGLREVDVLMRAVGRERLPRARVVVEPLPAVWEALRLVARRSHEYWAVRAPDHDWLAAGTWVDPVLEGLAVQQRGKELPAALEAKLLDLLLTRFESPDTLAGTVSTIAGIARPVRRADPHFVRVPIRWRGEVRNALALRLHVEQQDAAGQWHGPPWGLALQVATNAGGPPTKR